MKTQTLIGATDGSEKNSNQAGGWTLYDTKQETLVSGSAPIPGHPLTANSTRPERGIQIIVLHIILLAAQTHKIHTSTVKIYIDNISSYLHTIKPKKQNGPLTHLTNDYDLKTIIHKFETNLWITHKIEIIYHHVKGHQDDNI